MLITHVTLKNFRCFRAEQTARLAPVTFLVGENSTGKTSFMAAIRALWDVAFRRRVPDFKEPPYDLGSFDDIAHYRKLKGEREDSFRIGFEVARPESEEVSGGAARFDVTFERKGTAPFPVAHRIADATASAWLEHYLDERHGWKYRLRTPGNDWDLPDRRFGAMGRNLQMEERLPTFADLADVLRYAACEGADAPRNVPRLSEAERKLFRRALGSLRRITRASDGSSRPYSSAPIRSRPRRTYDPSRLTWDPEGDYIPAYVVNLGFRDKARWERLKGNLENFGRESGLFDEISIRFFGETESDSFQIQIKKNGGTVSDIARNLIDVGYGVSQGLPILAELLRDDAPPICLLQQPEVHLHPSAQAALGSLFCRVAEQRRQLAIETHSDYLADRVRMDVRDRKTTLKPEEVSILYFERGEVGVRIHSLRMDKQGNICGAPRGYRRFFQKEVRRSIGL